MKKEIAIVVALGCVGAFAATNYDVLGRNGSKMKSPMVYKNVDYSKVKTDKQKVGSSIDNRALKRLASGIKNGHVAIEGVYNNAKSHPYSLKIYNSGEHDELVYQNMDHDEYFDEANKVFKKIKIENVSSTALRNRYYQRFIRESDSRMSYTGANGFTFTSTPYTFSSPVQQLNPYGGGLTITYAPFEGVKILMSQRYSISWFDEGSPSSTNKWGDVGVYMMVGARPAMLNPDKKISYVRYNDENTFNAIPDEEVKSSRMYSVLKGTSKKSVVFVNSSYISNPGNEKPQVYIGVHNDNMQSQTYTAAARSLDNYIYDNRTVEIVGAGNNFFYGYNMGLKAGAANAITVGAVNPMNSNVSMYTSPTFPRYCKAGNCNAGGGSTGTRKPEIYGYSDFYMEGDRMRSYAGPQTTYQYLPYDDGTEISAAYTAGIVSDLLAMNPFYRWHPEVVKALLMASSNRSMGWMMGGFTASGATIPTYNDIGFDENHQNTVHESRYWIGSIDKMMPRTDAIYPLNHPREVRFAVRTSDFPSNNFEAAISWLCSGNDIANLGKLPQEFDLEAFESDTPDTSVLPSYAKYGIPREGSIYRKLSITTTKPYILFRIILMSDDAESENYGQMVLGFDVTSVY